MTWAEVCADPSLRDLPYKIELNRYGNIEMSPAKSRHSEYQGEIVYQLRILKPDGKSIPECPVETVENTKVPDVAWVSFARREATPHDPSYTVAPEICVEVISFSNSVEELMHKGRLYLQAGALEFWLCDATGAMRFYNAGGELEGSLLCPGFPRRVEA